MKKKDEKMKKIYEKKRVWKYYFMLIIFLAPLVIATVKWTDLSAIDTVAFILFALMIPYVIITSLIREIALQEVDKQDIININEMKIIKAVNYLVVGMFIVFHVANTISIIGGEMITPLMLMFFAVSGLLRDAGVVITEDTIYYGNTIIDRKEIVEVEKKGINYVKIHLANAKVVKIRYKKVALYFETY